MSPQVQNLVKLAVSCTEGTISIRSSDRREAWHGSTCHTFTVMCRISRRLVTGIAGKFKMFQNQSYLGFLALRDAPRKT